MNAISLQEKLQGKTVLVMAGGTGGHVFPALATAEALQQQGLKIEWLGTARGIESDLVPKAGIPITYIRIAGLRGKGKLSLLLAPFKLLIALCQALSAMRRLQPVCVLGMGGFASGPGGLARPTTRPQSKRSPSIVRRRRSLATVLSR